MSDEVVQTPFGAFLVTRGEIIGETTRAGTLWDGPGFLQVIAKEHAGFGQPGVTVIDVGANQGAFSIWLARQGAWRVVAVEPVPEVMQRLKANLDLNREVTAGVVIPVSTAAYSEACRLAPAPLDAGNWGGTALVPTEDPGALPAIALDTLGFLYGVRVSLIKVDAQGCDARVLEGLWATIVRDRPVVVFEWEAGLAAAHGRTLAEVTARFAAIAYRVDLWPTHANNYLARPQGRVDPWSGVD